MNLTDNITSEKIYTFKAGNIILIANNFKELEYHISFAFGRNSKKYQQYQEAVTYYNNHNWYGGFCSDLYYLGFFVNPQEEARELLKREFLKKEGK